MKVGELIKLLSEFDPELEVVTPGFDEIDYVPLSVVTSPLVERPDWLEAGYYSNGILEEPDVVEVQRVVLVNHDK
jgi:hypothetical protein